MSRLLISAMRPFSDRLANVAATMAGDVSEFKTKLTGPAQYAHAGRSERFISRKLRITDNLWPLWLGPKPRNGDDAAKHAMLL